MKLYDISQEIFSCDIYKGDPRPEKKILCSMNSGELYNLTAFSMCAHNGTHIDAPSHFLKDGDSIDEIPLYKTVGCAAVISHKGDISALDAESLLKEAEKKSPEAAKRILIKGDAKVTADAARVFAASGIYLIGTETQSVGPMDAPMEVHKILLSEKVVLLEGIRLSDVPDGIYFLSAAPIDLGGCDGAPCRAVLIDFKTEADA